MLTRKLKDSQVPPHTFRQFSAGNNTIYMVYDLVITEHNN